MDKRPFARVANKKVSSGHYVNFLLAGEATLPASIHHAFERDDDVFRIQINQANEPAETQAA